MFDFNNRPQIGWRGVLQADAYGGYNDLYLADRDAGPVTSALCWAHARRKFFELADIAGNVRKGKPAHQISPEAVKRIDAIFDIERERVSHCAPLVREQWRTGWVPMPGSPRARSSPAPGR